MGSLEDLDKSFENLLKRFPDSRAKLVNEAGNIMYNQVISNIERDVEEHSGNLKRGVTKKVGSKGGYAAVKPNYNISPHAHLVENGYNLVRGGKLGKGGKVLGWVHGKHVYRNAINRVADLLEQKGEELINQLAGDFNND